MIHLISEANSRLYCREIEALHRVRTAIFIDELGWDLKTTNGQEFDEYDDTRARNMVGFSAENDVIMGLRFRPTDDFAMLSDHFPQALMAGGRPINDNYTWELSRGFCRERGVRRQNLRRKAACMVAPLELAYQSGINRCVGFTDVRMLSFCYSVGWKLNLLGSPMHYGQGDAVAYEVEVSRQALSDIRNMWGLPSPACVEITALDPGEANVHVTAERLTQEQPELLKIAAIPEWIVDHRAPLAAATADTYYGAFQVQAGSAGSPK